MGLVSATEMLNKAKEGHYAVGQFNINYIFSLSIKDWIIKLFGEQLKNQSLKITY